MKNAHIDESMMAFFTVFMLIFLITFHILPTILVNSATISQCEPPNNCSYHVFRVRLSQKPESEDDDIPENATIVSVVQRKKYGSNYYEIKGGNEMTEKFAKEIIQNIPPENSDPRLTEKILKNDFYLKPVGPLERRILSATIPPATPVRARNYQTPPNPNPSPNEFPFLLVALLLCIGIVLGILFTAVCLIMSDIRKEPKFDRTNVVTFKKSIETTIERRPMIRRQEQFEMRRTRDAQITFTAPHSQASSVRLGPSTPRSQFTPSHRV